MTVFLFFRPLDSCGEIQLGELGLAHSYLKASV